MAAGISFLFYSMGTLFSYADAAETDDHLYVTGQVMEIDRCASAWLIRHYIDPLAHFEFLNDEELMSSRATTFDTPYSEFQRTHRTSTFEAIQNKYEVNTPRVNAISDMIHDIEINFWTKSKEDNTVRFQIELKQILQSSADNRSALKNCFEYLNNLPLKGK